MIDSPKSIFLSALEPCFCNNILWLNTIAAGTVALEAHWGLFQPLLAIDFYIAVAAVLPVANAMLRVFTSWKRT